MILKIDNPFHNSKVSKRIGDSVRFDGQNHTIGIDSKKSRCGLCGKTTTKKCMKCDIKLHDYCFSAFHGLKV